MWRFGGTARRTHMIEAVGAFRIQSGKQEAPQWLKDLFDIKDSDYISSELQAEVDKFKATD